MKLLGELDRFLTISDFTDHFHIWFVLEHAAETAANQAVIIHQQDCDLLLHMIPLSPVGP